MMEKQTIAEPSSSRCGLSDPSVPGQEAAPATVSGALSFAGGLKCME